MMLYVRMVLVMFVTLYTSRKILQLLGVEDFGIYNAIGGVVLVFTFVNSALSSSTARFLAFELGRNDEGAFIEAFNISLVLHIVIGLSIIILSETIGLWFVTNYLNIPQERVFAANVVYQLSVVTTFWSILRVPFNSWIIAYEDFTFYAYTGGVEAVLKLLLIFLLGYIPGDKLILYASLIMMVTFIINVWYYIYCRRNRNYGFYIVREKSAYIGQLKFSAFRLLGAASQVTEQQGGNLVMNIYHGVVVNAALGIANQVNMAVNMLLSGFQNAFHPIITKLYAAREMDNLSGFIISTSKVSFLLICFLGVPLMINVDYALEVWLGTVPPKSSLFCVLIILCSIIESFSAPLWMTILATGKIASYQIILSLITFGGFIVAFIGLYVGAESQFVLYCRMATYVVIVIFRLVLVHRCISLPLKPFLVGVLLRPILLMSFIFLLLQTICVGLHDLNKLLVSGLLYVPIFSIAVYCFCLSNDERVKVRSIINKYIAHE